MKRTYRAMQVTSPGTLELVERAIPTPGDGEVLIAVDACGICGADAKDIEGPDTNGRLPRVPGHEVVGRIAAIGRGTPGRWKIGQRVGVGRLGGHCNECDPCRGGQFQLCTNQPIVGATCDGGYAEMMIARKTGLVAIPDELTAEEAAPILCAGLATFNALKKCGAEAGDVVAIVGIGGLGHMALQYARKMGFKVTAIGRGDDIADDARSLGAYDYIDTARENAVEYLQRLGGAKAVISTIGDLQMVSALMPGIAAQGRLVVLGIGKDPLTVSSGPLVGGERSVLGSITGTPFENEKTLDFSVLVGVRPQFETMPFEQAASAFEKMKSGGVKFRVVLTMEKDDASE
ncbi:alcohol dehydrogenase [Rhizobium etli bv. phaseoli str. IE4803]|nr:alcohol dehydrogenase [Rhizobium etli bv. phaseoli str. IE4803]